LRFNNENYSGEGGTATPKPSPVGRGHPLPIEQLSQRDRPHAM